VAPVHTHVHLALRVSLSASIGDVDVANVVERGGAEHIDILHELFLAELDELPVVTPAHLPLNQRLLLLVGHDVGEHVSHGIEAAVVYVGSAKVAAGVLVPREVGRESVLGVERVDIFDVGLVVQVVFLELVHDSLLHLGIDLAREQPHLLAVEVGRVGNGSGRQVGRVRDRLELEIIYEVGGFHAG